MEPLVCGDLWCSHWMHFERKKKQKTERLEFRVKLSLFSIDMYSFEYTYTDTRCTLSI